MITSSSVWAGWRKGISETIHRPASSSSVNSPSFSRSSWRPSVAGRFDDRFVGFEHAVRELVLAQVLPDVLDWIELGGARGKEDEGDVLRHDQATGRMPAGP